VVYGTYEKPVDRESAYEKLKSRAEQHAPAAAAPSSGRTAEAGTQWEAPPPVRRGGRQRDTMWEAMAKSAARSVGSQLGRQILRGVLGSMFGGSRRSSKHTPAADENTLG